MRIARDRGWFVAAPVRMPAWALAGALGGVVGATADTAGAATVQIRDAVGGETANGNPGGYYLAGTGSRPKIALGGDSFHSGYAGVFDFEINHLDGSGWQSLLALCIQPEVDLPFGTRSSDEIGAMYEPVALDDHARFSPQRAQWTRLLWANAFDDAQQNKTNAAAFQLLLWEFVTDETPNLLDGEFRLDISDPFTAGAFAVADEWLSNILGGTWTRTAQLVALTNADGQDLIMQIPAPGALALLVLLPGSRASRRRRRA